MDDPRIEFWRRIQEACAQFTADTGLSVGWSGSTFYVDGQACVYQPDRSGDGPLRFPADPRPETETDSK